jgi:hypothetical protein
MSPSASFTVAVGTVQTDNDCVLQRILYCRVEMIQTDKVKSMLKPLI